MTQALHETNTIFVCSLISVIGAELAVTQPDHFTTLLHTMNSWFRVALLCSCVYYAQCPAPQLCNKGAINAAADLTLYYIKHNFTDVISISDIDQSFLKDSLQLHAKGGTFGHVHSVERINDFDLAFTNEKSNNYNKPLTRKLYTMVQAKFSGIHIQFNDCVIKAPGCSIKGKISITVKKNLFEAVTVSSDKKNCLMDLRLIKFHEFGPIDFQILPEEGKICAALTSTVINKFNQYFSSFTKGKMRQLMMDFMRETIPETGKFLCMSPTFDVVFV